MTTLRVPPTRMNLMRTRRDARRTADGLRLLKSKREALMKAFLATVQERVRHHDLLVERCRAAGVPYVEALARHGQAGLNPFGWAARRDFALEVEKEVVWGIPVATFRTGAFVRDFRRRGYDPGAAGPEVNRAADAFEAVLAVVLETAASDVRLKRLGSEVQKTTRRINALEETILPELSGTEKRIREKLHELERDESQRLRRLRSGRRRRERCPPGPGKN